MIYDKIENLEKYASLHLRFANAIAYLKQLIAENVSNGRHDMPNCDVPNAVFANVTSYNTSKLGDMPQMEAHHKYIDIQIVLAGEEVIYLPTVDCLRSTKEYDEALDYELFEMPTESENVRLVMRPNTFVIFFTNEPHIACIVNGEPGSVHKIVGKVLQ